MSMLPPVIHGFHGGCSFQSSKPKFFENHCLSNYGNGLILRDRRGCHSREPTWALDACGNAGGSCVGQTLALLGRMNSSLCSRVMAGQRGKRVRHTALCFERVLNLFIDLVLFETVRVIDYLLVPGAGDFSSLAGEGGER